MGNLIPQYMTNSNPGAMLNAPRELSQGSCRTVAGIVAMDSYVDLPQSEYRRDLARAICESCPVRQACGRWILAAENPRGAWGGMYAGLTPQQRRDAPN